MSAIFVFVSNSRRIAQVLSNDHFGLYFPARTQLRSIIGEVNDEQTLLEVDIDFNGSNTIIIDANRIVYNTETHHCLTEQLFSHAVGTNDDAGILDDPNLLVGHVIGALFQANNQIYQVPHQLQKLAIEVAWHYLIKLDKRFDDYDYVRNFNKESVDVQVA